MNYCEILIWISLLNNLLVKIEPIKMTAHLHLSCVFFNFDNIQYLGSGLKLKPLIFQKWLLV